MNKPTKANDKQNERVYTYNDVAKKTNEIIAPIEEEAKKKRKELINNAATIISILTIGIFVTLYYYYSGYCKVYNIPINCAPIDIKSFIPVAGYAMTIFLWFLYYIIEVREDRLLKRNRFNPLRIMYGVLVFQSLFFSIHLDYIIGKVFCGIIAVSVSLIHEAVMFYIHKPKEENKINRITYSMKVEDRIHGRLFFSYYVKTGLFYVFIAIVLTPYIGKLFASTKLDYSIFQKSGKSYAVIIEYDDKVLAQCVRISENSLFINNISYAYFNKNDIVLQYRTFDSVSVKEYLEIDNSLTYSL